MKSSIKYISLLIISIIISSTTTHADLQEGLNAAHRGDYAVALSEWKASADQGNSVAQHNLGLMYTLGDGVPQNYVEAMKWYRLAANQGYAYAQHNIGLMYDKGNGVEQNYGQAVKWYRLAGEGGNVRAQFILGLWYSIGDQVSQNNEEAVKWYRLATDQGHERAQLFLASMYALGLGVPRDYIEAEKLYRLAADQENAEAQFNLGTIYANGKGVTQNYIEAMKWYRLAANQRHAKAQNNLGAIYDYGYGVLVDDVEAVRWYRRSADQGSANAQFNLGKMYDNGRGIPEDNLEAMRLYRLAAEQGDADALLILTNDLTDDQSLIPWNNSMAPELIFKDGDQVFFQACSANPQQYFSTGKLLGNFLREVPNIITSIETSPYFRPFITEANSTIKLENGVNLFAELDNFRDFRVLDEAGNTLFEKKVSGATSIYEIRHQDKTIAWGVGWHKTCKEYYEDTEFTAFRVLLPVIKKGEILVQDKLLKGAYITSYSSHINNNIYPVIIEADNINSSGASTCYYCLPRFLKLSHREGFKEITQLSELKKLMPKVNEANHLMFVAWMAQKGLTKQVADYIASNYEAVYSDASPYIWYGNNDVEGPTSKRMRKEYCLEQIRKTPSLSIIGKACYPELEARNFFSDLSLIGSIIKISDTVVKYIRDPLGNKVN